MNININRFYERMPEIGVRKSFGASIRKLITQFLFENILITIAGGILSVVLSYFLIIIINHSSLIPGIKLQISFLALVVCFVFVLLLGILSSLIPSLKMAKMAITDSLCRNESNK